MAALARFSAALIVYVLVASLLYEAANNPEGNDRAGATAVIALAVFLCGGLPALYMLRPWRRRAA